MFGCIYFKEDNTLTVVSEHSRNLNVKGSFSQSSDCVMKWSGKNFDGVILKTSESETELNKLCKKLAIFVQNSAEKPVSLKSLLKKVKELCEAEAEIKISKKHSKKKSVVLDQNSAVSSQKEETNDNGRPYSSLLKENSSQTLNDVWEQINSSLRVVEGDEINEKSFSSSCSVSLLNQLKAHTSAMLEVVDKLVTHLESTPEKKNEDVLGNVNSTGCDEDSPHITDLDYQNRHYNGSDFPQPQYSMEMQQHSQQNISTARNSQQNFQQTQGQFCTPKTQPTFDLTQHSQIQYPQHMQQSPFNSLNMQQSTWNPQITQPSTSIQQIMQPCTLAKQTYALSSPPQYVNISFQPEQHQQMQQEMTENLDKQHSNQQLVTGMSTFKNKVQKREREQDSSESETEESLLATPLRRSPRKKLFTSPTTTETSTKMVKLMKSSDVMVDSNRLKKARQASFKHPKPAYTLMAKLMPCVFTKEEMANSRGQGLGPARQGDVRPALDPVKIQLCKDYVAAWLKESQLSGQGDIELNQAITQQVDSARKCLRLKQN